MGVRRGGNILRLHCCHPLTEMRGPAKAHPRRTEPSSWKVAGMWEGWKGKSALQPSVAPVGLAFFEETPVCASLTHILCAGQKWLLDPKRQYLMYGKMHFLLAVCLVSYTTLTHTIIITIMKIYLLIEEPWGKLGRLLSPLWEVYLGTQRKPLCIPIDLLCSLKTFFLLIISHVIWI